MKQKTIDPSEGEVPGQARGWTNTITFGRGGRRPRAGSPSLRMSILNTESGTGSSLNARRALLVAAVERVRTDEPTVLITPAGFFGCTIDVDGNPRWPGLDATSLKVELTMLARPWPPSLMLAIGVDIAGHAQQQ